MNTRVLLRLVDVPVYQNKMFEGIEAALACPRGEVRLAQDQSTGFVANIAFDPDALTYDESYQNEQGHSSLFQAHLADVLGAIDRHFRAARILEIGCGKGAFVDMLRAGGHDAGGVDPAYEGNSPHIVKAAFEPGLGLRGDAIVMRHVLEHIPRPLDFLGNVRDANGGTGRIYIEVPCFDWILREHAWFDVFYEHVNYFRLGDFHRMFGVVHEAGHLFGGQYLYAIAELSSLRDPATAAGFERVEVPQDFFSAIDSCLAGAGSGKRIVWGAAAKGVMFSHHARARGLSLDFAVDINPAKQGMFLAGSGLPVLSPGSALRRMAGGDTIYVMNSNYIGEITAAAGNAFNYIPVDRT
jgi:hypothetical protein